MGEGKENGKNISKFSNTTRFVILAGAEVISTLARKIVYLLNIRKIRETNILSAYTASNLTAPAQWQLFRINYLIASYRSSNETHGTECGLAHGRLFSCRN